MLFAERVYGNTGLYEVQQQKCVEKELMDLIFLYYFEYD